MERRFVSFVLILAASACAALTAHAQSEIQQRLRHRVEAGLVTGSFDFMDERVFARETLRRLYPARDFAPLWVSEDGLSAHAEQFIRWLETEPARNGLRPEHYHLEAIESIDGDRVGELVDLELALSDSFLILGSHLLAGRLNPETLSSEWIANRRHRDLAPVLEAVGNGVEPGALLEDLLPRHPEYRRLVTRLAELRAIRDRGGWPLVGAGPTLRPGDADPRVVPLRERLRLAGDFVDAGTGSDTGVDVTPGFDSGAGADSDAGDRAASERYDAALEAAVVGFQRRHGLTADGIVGRATLAALDLPIQQRINQIIVNLERWRWLPESLGERYVIVNIAGFRLDVIEQGDSVLSMPVVVGRPFRRTPVFSDTIRYLVLNPSWEVPSRIATQDKLPLIRENPNYLADQGYDLLEGWGADERRIDPASIDWSAMTARDFRYRLRQRPGELNALGRVKFMFPNQFSVYLHDTPARELFGEDVRAFSSGCIRLGDPLALAELLLRENPSWSRETIDGTLAEGRERTVTLPQPVPVHLLYWTVWVDSDGVLQFRDDIYERDAPVLRELREDPPT